MPNGDEGNCYATVIERQFVGDSRWWGECNAGLLTGEGFGTLVGRWWGEWSAGLLSGEEFETLVGRF